MPEMALNRLWSSSTDLILNQLASRATGLSASEAEVRLVRYGPNRITKTKPMRLIAEVARRISDPLVAILLTAAVIAGDLPSFAIILMVVAVSLTLDVAQEYRAEMTAEALRRFVAI